MALTDGMLVSASFWGAEIIRYGSRTPPLQVAVAVSLTPFIWIAVFSSFHLYGMPRFSAAEEFRRLISASSLSFAVVIVGSFMARFQFSRGWLTGGWAASLVLILVGRRAWHIWMGRARARGDLALRTVIVGANGEALRIVEALREGMSVHGLNPVGIVSSVPGEDLMTGLPVLGDIDDLGDVVREHGVECLFLASTSLDDDQAKAVTQVASGNSLEVRVSANLYDVLSSRLTVIPVGNMLALSLRPVRLTGVQVALKRSFDLVVGCLLAVPTLPIWLAVAIAVKLDSKGPVLFRQGRITKGGRTFMMLKFRTMVSNADQVLAEREIDPTVPFFKLQDDPRLTRVGRVIRRLSLDEVPQLWNVLRGDMSLVGPRPLPADQVAANPTMLAPRHQVSAGVTGWWQIHGRSSVNLDEALRLDLFYIENWSLALDLYILGKTLGAILARRGAF
jgi:exopolysaccharide biosynthesis polyprenyl glycosylphosphotransferase